MIRKPHSKLACVIALLGSFLVGPAAAQQIPADDVLSGFAPNGEYVLKVEGEPVPGAEIFLAERAGMVLLVDAPGLDHQVLLSPRKQRAVETVPDRKVVERPDGARDILSDAELTPVGEFSMSGGEIRFAIDGKQYALAEAPYSLGQLTAAELEEKDPGYAYTAENYSMSRPMVDRLKKVEDPATVVVYFGTWCPFCRHHVPKAIRLAEELEGSQIAFEFYGLPKGFGDDPRAAKYGVTAVPTGIVYQNGKEVGRINGSQWNIPELVLKKMLVD